MGVIAMQIVHTDKKDFTLSNLREMIADGDIIPDPDYQRSYVFDDNKASRLVESVLIGIPIPTVYLSQEEDDSYTVIDGQQRITSIRRYLDKEKVGPGPGSGGGFCAKMVVFCDLESVMWENEKRASRRSKRSQSADQNHGRVRPKPR